MNGGIAAICYCSLFSIAHLSGTRFPSVAPGTPKRKGEKNATTKGPNMKAKETIVRMKTSGEGFLISRPVTVSQKPRMEMDQQPNALVRTNPAPSCGGVARCGLAAGAPLRLLDAAQASKSSTSVACRGRKWASLTTARPRIS